VGGTTAVPNDCKVATFFHAAILTLGIRWLAAWHIGPAAAPAATLSQSAAGVYQPLVGIEVFTNDALVHESVDNVFPPKMGDMVAIHSTKNVAFSVETG
jgi:hypothetical protein